MPAIWLCFTTLPNFVDWGAKQEKRRQDDSFALHNTQANFMPLWRKGMKHYMLHSVPQHALPFSLGLRWSHRCVAWRVLGLDVFELGWNPVTCTVQSSMKCCRGTYPAPKAAGWGGKNSRHFAVLLEKVSCGSFHDSFYTGFRFLTLWKEKRATENLWLNLVAVEVLL